MLMVTNAELETRNCQPAAVERSRLCVCVCVSLCVIISCKQEISQTNLWIVAKLVSSTGHKLPWKCLTYGTDQVQDDWFTAILVFFHITGCIFN